MLSLNFIREHPDLVKEGARKKGEPAPVDEILQLDGERRELLTRVEQLKAEHRRLGVVTAKRRPTVERVFAGAGIGDFFDVVVGSDDTERHKPHPEPVLKALELLDARPLDAAYVGDSPFDIAAARAAGVFAVAVGWGGIHRVEDADAVVGTPEELLGVL